MHLMLVNDDGIHAPGIRALCAAAAAAGHRVSLCAPSREQSGASHSMSFWSQLRPEKVDVPGAEAAYAVDATPATCARFGLYLICLLYTSAREGIEMPETTISTAFSAGSSEESGGAESGIRIAQMAEAAPNGHFQRPLRCV